MNSRRFIEQIASAALGQESDDSVADRGRSSAAMRLGYADDFAFAQRWSAGTPSYQTVFPPNRMDNTRH